MKYIMRPDGSFISEDELYHWGLFKSKPREDHKYIKREWKNGRWKYYYDVETAKKDTAANIKNNADKTVSNTLSSMTKTVNNKINAVIDKGKSILNKIYSDPNNMYYMNSNTYNEKMAKVKESKEWKDIVAKQDPEYIKKNEDGTTTYLIDDYVVKKKHPVLDIASDVAAGRKVDINEITKDSTVAALRDYAVGAINVGMIAVGVVTTALTEKFKFQQGTYNDEVKALTTTITNGSKYAKQMVGSAQAISEGSVEEGLQLLNQGKKVAAKTNASGAVKSINEGNVIKAAQVILESDAVRSTVGSNEYYQLAEQTLGGLSDEEIAALSLLLRQMRA